MHALAPADLRRPDRLLRTRAPWAALLYLLCEVAGGIVAVTSWFTVVLIPVWLLAWPRIEPRLVGLAGHPRPRVTRSRWEMRWQDVVLVLLTAPMAAAVGIGGFFLLILIPMLFAAPFVIASGRPITGWDADDVLPSVPTAIISPILGLVLLGLVLWVATALAHGWAWLSVALLRDDAKRLEAQVRALSDDAVRAGDAIALERRALERDLHDGAQMHLSAAGMRLAMLRLDAETLPDGEGRRAVLSGLDAVGEQLDLASSSVRSAASGLVPPALRDGGLDAALAELAESVPIEVDLEGRVPRLPDGIEQSVYLVASEALTNVVRHAGAQRVCVRCEVTAGGQHAVGVGGTPGVDDAPSDVAASCAVLLLEISDDGRGGAEPTGTGLVSMQARARSLGGTFEVSSPVGGPTVLRMGVPVGDAPGDQEESP